MFDVSTPETFVIDSIMAAADTTPAVQKILYDRKSASFALSISTRTLDYCVANGLIDFVKQGSKVMFLHSALTKFARTNHSSLCSSVDEDAA
jgi:hypothetical protein